MNFAYLFEDKLIKRKEKKNYYYALAIYNRNLQK